MKKIIAVILLLTMVIGISACSRDKEVQMDLDALYAQFLEKLPAMIQLSEADMLDYIGLDATSFDQAIVAISLDGLLADEVWLVRAKDQNALSQIRELAKMRIQYKTEETENYLPEQYAVVKQGLMAEKGLYFALLVSPEVMTLKTEFESAAK